MNENGYLLLKTMDLSMIETQLAIQCAPVLTRLKLSNLLIIEKEQEADLSKILLGTGISVFKLYESLSKSTFLLYRANELKPYLDRKFNRFFLSRIGYPVNGSFENLLHTFKSRYILFQKVRQDFPHEAGIFLGYPIEDVIGFIRHQGSDFLYCGYWKVYKNPLIKMQIFQKYQEAENQILEFIADGQTIVQAIESYNSNQLHYEAV